MSEPLPRATDDYSKPNRARTARSRPLGGLATAAAGLGIAGAVLAFVATFTTVIQIRVLTVTPATFDGKDRYGPALFLLGILALAMVAGAWRGARPAMAALALAGLTVLLIAILVDVPHLNDSGVWPLADQYEDAEASAGIGFYFETAAGVLMLFAGAMMLLLTPAARPVARRERPPRPERPVPGPDDWFAEPPEPGAHGG